MSNVIEVKSLEQMPAALQWMVNEIHSLKSIISNLPVSTLAQSPANEYITRREAAAKLHLSLNTLDTYSQEGKLKAYRIGTRILYKTQEIEAALQAMKTTSGKAA